MAKGAKSQVREMHYPWHIVEIRVAGFKSIREEQTIEIRPLTILAGANSSGKSSIMQPLLLLKQTLENSYDPGALLLNGPNVKFTSADQLLARTGKGHSLDSFHIGMRVNTGEHFQTRFRKEDKVGFRIERMDISDAARTFAFCPGMTDAEIVDTGILEDIESQFAMQFGEEGQWVIQRARCFLDLAYVAKGPGASKYGTSRNLGALWTGVIRGVIHLPGWRGNSERTYARTAVGPSYSGTFQQYTASIISEWMTESNDSLAKLNADLKAMRLTSGVSAEAVNDVQIELHVGRLPDVAPKRPEDRVNIADVGVGVSQVLPLLVALHAAKPGSLVYVEQPENDLHPRARLALAHVLAAAAMRGVQVVVETHSSTLLLGVQSLVAEGRLEPDLVKLHWFQRKRDGRTIVRSGNLDEAGRFGDWPEDFDDIALESQKRYLDAAEKRMFAL